MTEPTKVLSATDMNAFGDCLLPGIMKASTDLDLDPAQTWMILMAYCGLIARDMQMPPDFFQRGIELSNSIYHAETPQRTLQ
jgi:hypothetical protein